MLLPLRPVSKTIRSFQYEAQFPVPDRSIRPTLSRPPTSRIWRISGASACAAERPAWNAEEGGRGGARRRGSGVLWQGERARGNSSSIDVTDGAVNGGSRRGSLPARRPVNAVPRRDVPSVLLRWRAERSVLSRGRRVTREVSSTRPTLRTSPLAAWSAPPDRRSTR